MSDIEKQEELVAQSKQTYDNMKMVFGANDETTLKAKLSYDKAKKELDKMKKANEPKKPAKKLVIKTTKPVENEKVKPAEKKPKKGDVITIIKRKQGRPRTSTQTKKGQATALLKQQGATDIETGEKKEVDIVVKGKRGRPRTKERLEDLEGEDLLKFVEKQSAQADKMEKEKMERLAQRKKEREQAKAEGKKRIRARKYKTEEEAKEAQKQKTKEARERRREQMTDKAKREQKKNIAGMTSQLVINNYKKYRLRTTELNEMMINDPNFFVVKDIPLKTIVNNYQNQIIPLITHNTDITEKNLKDVYELIKETYEDFDLTYLQFLDEAFMALYIYTQINGFRISKPTGKRARTDEKDIAPEYSVFLQDNDRLNAEDKYYWVIFVYNRLKTGKWDKSFKELEDYLSFE